MAQRLLDGGMHEDARDLRVRGGAPDQLQVEQGEDLGIDGERILSIDSAVYPLAPRREDAVGHGGKQDIGVEPDLVAGMAVSIGPPRGCDMSRPGDGP